MAALAETTKREESRPGGWRVRVLEQYAAYLATSGKVKDLECLLERYASGAGEAPLRYYLGLAHALANREDAALEQLRAALRIDAGYPQARALGYRLLVREAGRKAAQQDWAGLSETVADAVRFAPPGADPDQDLAAFRDCLPAAHLRSGNRSAAVQHWENALRQGNGDPRLLHNLALAHHWWALGVEKEAVNGEPVLAEAWNGAIAYWCLLLRQDSFWNDWNRVRKDRIGMCLSDAELAALRSDFGEEQLEHHLQNRSAELRAQGDAAKAGFYDNLMVALMRERRSADAFQAALAELPDADAPALLRMPGGYLLFERLGLLAEVRALAERLPANAECLLRMNIAFSPDGLGLVEAAIEDRPHASQALALLDGLPPEVRDGGPAAYLRVRALRKAASELAGQGQFAGAVEHWRNAVKLAAERAKSPGPGIKGGLFKDAAKAIRAEAAQVVQKEAGRLKREEKLDAAVKLLEDCSDLDADNALRDMLCIFYCDRGSEHLKAERYESAKTQFNKALKRNSSHQRAKEGLSTTYNNEACDSKDQTAAEKLFLKALEANPQNHGAQRNLAGLLKSRAVDRLNEAIQSANRGYTYGLRGACDSAISDMERAAKLVNDKLDSSFFGALRGAATLGLGEGLLREVADQVLKNILENLTVAYQIRSKL